MTVPPGILVLTNTTVRNQVPGRIFLFLHSNNNYINVINACSQGIRLQLGLPKIKAGSVYLVVISLILMGNSQTKTQLIWNAYQTINDVNSSFRTISREINIQNWMKIYQKLGILQRYSFTPEKHHQNYLNEISHFIIIVTSQKLHAKFSNLFSSAIR